VGLPYAGYYQRDIVAEFPVTECLHRFHDFAFEFRRRAGTGSRGIGNTLVAEFFFFSIFGLGDAVGEKEQAVSLRERQSAVGIAEAPR
jgi:hypothetical protein